MTIHRRPKSLGTVVHSQNEMGGLHCVDIFRRADATFGFELYRRDPETGEGWFPIGFHSGRVFATRGEAERTAAADVAWFSPPGEDTSSEE
ncbi:MAG: hypothetical protein AAF764_05340 [Pseudomonadota bacterium]